MRVCYALYPLIHGQPDSSARGKALTAALQRLGPSFIKLGQALSSRPDLIGEATARALSELQDRVAPFPFREVEKAIAVEFGQPASQLFGELSATPLASASVAQVHRATSRDGRMLAVKILRPGIEQALARDLAFFRWGARMLERLIPRARRLKPVEVVEVLARTIAQECDLRMEAASASLLRENLGSATDIRIPEVVWEYTGKRVLSLEFIEAAPVLQAPETLNRTSLIRTIATRFFEQVFRHGFFHADLHPGNILVEPTGRVALVDFGIMGSLDARNRYYLAQMLTGFLKRDYTLVARAHFQAGYVPRHHSEADFALACRAIAEPVLGRPLAQISFARLLGQLFTVTEQFDMETQPQLLLLQKNMMLLEGIARQLDPAVNMWELAEAPISAWLHEQMGVKGHASRLFAVVRKVMERVEAVADTHSTTSC